MQPTRPRNTSGPCQRRGFTLVELLVVIAIIAVLVAITVAVASQVTQGGKKGYTENILRTLDQTYASWAADNQSKTPQYFTDEAGTGEIGTKFPIIDARSTDGGKPVDVEPSLSLLLFAMGDSENVRTMLRGIDAKLIARGTVTSPGIAKAFPIYGTVRRRGAGGISENRDDGLTINDAWGNPIRAVVRGFDGGYGEYFNPGGAGVLVDKSKRPYRKLTFQVGNAGQVPIEYRRSYRYWDDTPANGPPPGEPPYIGDADEGLCTAGAPYFYSAGPDKDPGTRSDNVYSAPHPAYPPETAKFNVK